MTLLVLYIIKILPFPQEKVSPLLGVLEVGKVLYGSFSDFEDGLQYFSAYHGGSKVIIARDAKGFRSSEIPFITPETYLELFFAE
ncbi:MAG: hypothetical protein AAF587_02110 [Bacteroidota bacterium]